MLSSFLIANARVGATNVSGLISSDTKWTVANSPYIVNSNLLVNFGVTLTIEPGVTVKLDTLTCIQIDGTLIAKGSVTDSIRFTSNKSQKAGVWGYIYFSEKSADAVYDENGDYLSGNILEYCKIEYAGNSAISNNGALRLVTNPFINHCTISNNSAPGIRAFGTTSSNFKICNSVIAYNSSIESNAGGIFVSGPLNICIQNNTIAHNEGGGISCTSIYGGNVIIENNIISYNSAWGGGGIGCDGDYYTKKIKIAHNVITFNHASGSGGGGISATSIDSLGIVGNIISNNSADFNAGVYGGGYLKNNIIANNTSASTNSGIYCISSGKYQRNSIVNNTAQDNTGAFISQYGSPIFQQNTFAFNTNSNISENKDMLIKVLNSDPTFTNNNIFENSTSYSLLLDVAQNSNVISADNNWWGTTNVESIQNKVYDWFDNNNLRIVNYTPYLDNPNTIAPISPPANVIKSDIGNGQVKITWHPNSESDIAGYHIYYGDFNGYSFSNMKDVINDTTFVLTEASISDTIAVTAYDQTYNTDNELNTTIVNDNMTNGNESWFSFAKNKLPSGIFSSKDGSLLLTPNPVTDVFKVTGFENTAIISLFNLDGRLFFSKEINADEQIRIGFLPQGVYIVKICTADLSIQKIIVKR